MWMNGEYSGTPGPAPGRSRSRETRVPTHADRRAAFRQHRSVDDPEFLVTTGRDPYSFSDPLSISTAHPYPPVSQSGAPLSNPITTTHSFWQNPHINIGGGMKNFSLEGEYAQLREEFAATVEKLNQTMYSIKTFWSPELKRERQLRREEQARMMLLERRLAERGGDPYGRGLEGASAEAEEHILMLQGSCSRLQDSLRAKEEEIAALCMEGGGGGRALENALARLDERSERVRELEDEVMQLRGGMAAKPRDFTQKTPTSHELVTLRMKLERSEVELSQTKTEKAACETRLRNSEDELNELRSHVHLLKNTATSKEEQSTLLMGDVEALRSKLEMRNRAIEQKEQQLEKLQRELGDARGEAAERIENIRKVDARSSQLMGRMEQLEGQLREKENELERVRQQLASHPNTHREREWMARLEEGDREKQRLQKAVEEVRMAAEKEHKAQLETYQTEVNRLRLAVETLEKELADRDVLLESQNEKIGDMGRDLSQAQKRMHDAMVDKGAEELRRELEKARGEVEKLLKMLHSMEKEKATLTAKIKQLMGEKDTAGEELHGVGMAANVKQRIQELEEALAESVSITAEREIHLSQQKQQLQYTATQLADTRRELKEVKERMSTMEGEGHDNLMKSIEAERKQHMEQLYQLKQEAVLSAIAEKETHIALLERSGGPASEMETVRRHKEALMRKLQEDNERRAILHRGGGGCSRLPPLPPSSHLPPSSVLPGNLAPSGVTFSPSARGAAPLPRGEVVEAADDGIWA